MNTPQKDPNYRLQPNYEHTDSQIYLPTFSNIVEYIIIKSSSIEGRNVYNLDEFVVTTVQKVAKKVKKQVSHISLGCVPLIPPCVPFHPET